MITRLHSHPGPLCRFLFSCSMPSSPPIPSLPSLFSLFLSLVPSAFNPSPPLLLCRIRLALLVVLPLSLARSFSFQYHREDLVLSVLHLYYAQRKKADTDSPCGSLLLYFDRSVGCVGSDRDASELETRDTVRNPLRTDE